MPGEAGDNDLPKGFLPAEGGPFHRLMIRAGLDGGGRRLRRRILVLAVLCWLPLLVLSAAQGLVAGTAVTVPFLHDITAHVRFLVVVPLLLVAEVFLQARLRPLAGSFLDRGLVAEADQPRFHAALSRARRLQGSAVAELVILALVYLVGVLWIYEHYTALSAATWMQRPTPDGPVRSLAGWWFGLVSLPLFQFLMLRWYFRLAVWILLLWRLSRLDLRLYPAHPDRAGGLGFLTATIVGFAPFVLAHGTLFAGAIADPILYLGAKPMDFQALLLALLVLMFCLLQLPLLVFTPQLVAAKLRGRAEYGRLGVQYLGAFEQKWLRGGSPGDKLLGSPDLQSLSDLGGSLALVAAMRVTLLRADGAVMIVAMLVLPLLPLFLSQMPLIDLLKKLSDILF